MMIKYIDTLIYCAGNHPQSIDWLTRLKIAIGSAKALAYLHEGCEFLLFSFHLKLHVSSRIVL